jgi:hypothetical protein
VIWCVPIGICSLIIAKLGHDGNFWAKLEQLSVFVGTTSSRHFAHQFFDTAYPTTQPRVNAVP